MGFLDNVRRALRPRDRATAELEYLNEATSLVDIERREREISRGRFRHLPRRF